MTSVSDLLNSFQQVLPHVIDWIDAYILDHRDKATSVSDLNYTRLGDYFLTELLDHSSVVFVDRVILPPLSKMGLPFFAEFEQTPYSGITYKDTFFLAPDAHNRESTWFHEMVHIIQWDELKPEPFLITYAIGLLNKGYRDSPLEAMAYDLQEIFDRQKTIPDLELLIRNNTRRIAESVDNAMLFSS